MTELTNADLEQTGKKTCISCGSTNVLPGYANDLCDGCRTAFINYPIPKWVWLFAAGIGVLLLISLVNLPKNISLGIDLERGVKSANDHRYVTAEKELKAFAREVPQSEKGNAYLLVASFNNLDFEAMREAYGRVKDAQIDDDELYNKVSSVMDNLNGYFASDSLDSFYAKYPPEDTALMYADLKNYITLHPNELYAQADYGSHLMNNEQYPAADSTYKIMLEKKDDYLPALYAMATIKRIEGKPEEAIAICNKVLAMNKEDAYAMSIKARALLRQKKNKEALQMAMASASVDRDSYYNTATLALVYHFNNMSAEETKVLQAMTTDKDSSAASYYQYALDVINNKQSFQ